MSDLQNEQLKESDKTGDLASNGAASALEKNSLETQTKQSTDSFQLLRSRLILLEAKDKHVANGERSAEPPPYDEIRKDLNDAITLAKLQELAWENAKESHVFQKYTSKDSFTEDANGYREQVKSELIEVYLKHNSLVEVLDGLVKERSQKLARGLQKSVELKHELQKFKKVLSIQTEELNTRVLEKDPAQNRIKNQILRKMDKLNVTRMLIVNLLGVSGVNFMKHPKLAKLVVKCRKQITMENLDTYKF